MDHNSILEDWRQHAEQHDDQNYQFLRSLKFQDYGFDPDELAFELHERVFQIVDCTRCANCCKTMTVAAFSEAYLTKDEDSDPAISQLPCPFLGDDNLCTIYDVRPAECREYPHTNKPELTSRTMGLASSALACPAVFWVIEEMRKRAR